MTSYSVRQFSAFCTEKWRLTMLTPPDWYTEHMAMRGASPMVVPWKDMPLQEGTREGHSDGSCEGSSAVPGSKWPSWCSLTPLTFPDHSQGERPWRSRPNGQLPGHHTSHFLSPTLSLLQRNRKGERSLFPTVCPEPHSLEGNGQGS